MPDGDVIASRGETRAEAAGPESDLARRGRADDLFAADRLDEAVQVYRDHLLRRADDGGAWFQLGRALRRQGKLVAAEESYRRALEVEPEHADVLCNLGTVLAELNRIDESLELHRRSIALRPDAPRLLCNFAISLALACRFEEAVALYDRALRIKPGDATAHLGRAEALLHLGDYAAAWRDYEWRWQTGQLPALQPSVPLWRGEDLAGKSILLVPEQGYGDILMSLRFLPLVAARAAEVVLVAEPRLARLIAWDESVVRLVRPGTRGPRVDLQAPLLSLPGLLGVMRDDLPAPTELAIPEDSRRLAKQRVPDLPDRFKVGFVWSGRSGYDGNALRAASLEHFLALARVPGVELFSLQKGPLEAELRSSGAHAVVTDLGGQDRDFADTAAAIERLDLVIMTDSAVAHLTGSLGRPIWNLLAYSPYWVFGPSGETTPWYPSMRLYRQADPGDWEAVFAEVARDLEAAVADKRTGNWPPASS